MALALARCNNCGTTLQVESTVEAAVCPSCGAPFVVAQAIQNYNAGYAYQQNIQVNQQMAYSQPAKKSNAVKIIAVILIIALLLGGGFLVYNMFFSKGSADALEGRYVSESGLYKIEFDDDFTCVWYQEIFGHEVYFDGTYEKVGDVYVLHMDGETYSYNTRFEAKPVERGLIVTGGLVNGELFVKQ